MYWRSSMVFTNHIQELADGNQILGEFPNLKNSEINFNGANNILYCEPGVTLSESSLDFKADNSVIYLGANRHEYKLTVSVYNDSVFHMGIHNFQTCKMTVILSEQRHCFIGDYGVFSWGICMRNSDPHLIYDCSTRKRVNPTQSIYIGDHVWVGQDCLILKGTQIDSGSIIGGHAVISGKRIPHNSTWAGNPARQIKDDIFWNYACVHDYKSDMTESTLFYDDYIEKFHQDYHRDEWIYDYQEAESINYDEMDRTLNMLDSSQKKLDYLIQLNKTKTKNRFVHRI